jgi:hypothetical protein
MTNKGSPTQKIPLTCINGKLNNRWIVLKRMVTRGKKFGSIKEMDERYD